MKWTYRVFRTVCLTVLALAILIPMLLYVLLSLPAVQNNLCDRAETELSKLLQTPVSINSLTVVPFNRVVLRGVTVTDNDGDTLMTIHRLSAGVNFQQLLKTREVGVDYAELTGLDARLWKTDPDAPLNIDHIIRALKGDNPDKPKSDIDLRLSTVVIRRTSLSYDLLSAPRDTGRFDKNHVKITDLRADIGVPKITRDSFVVDVKRIAFNEQSGFSMTDFNGLFNISKSQAVIHSLTLSLPNSLLELGPVELTYDNWQPKDPLDLLSNDTLNIDILTGSHLTPADFAAFVPELSGLTTPLNISTSLVADKQHLDIRHIDIAAADHSMSLLMNGTITNYSSMDSIALCLPVMSINTSAASIISRLQKPLGLPSSLVTSLNGLHTLNINGTLDADMLRGRFHGAIISSLGNIEINASYRRSSVNHPVSVQGKVSTDGFELAPMLPASHLGTVQLDATGTATFGKNMKKFDADAQIDLLEFKDYPYRNIALSARGEGDDIAVTADVDDPNARMMLTLGVATPRKQPVSASLNAEIKDVDLHALNLINKYPGYRLSANIAGDYCGFNPNEADGLLHIADLSFHSPDPENASLDMKSLALNFSGSNLPAEITLDSDFLDAEISGSYNLGEIVPAVKSILEEQFPVVFPAQEKSRNSVAATTHRVNDFTLNATLKYNEQLIRFLNLPVSVIYPVTIAADLDTEANRLDFDLNAPYLQQKDKLIEQTRLTFRSDSTDHVMRLAATTTVPTKNGPMTMRLNCDGADNRLHTHLDWKIKRQAAYEGDVDIEALFKRDGQDALAADIAINRSELTFNDSTWTVFPATIEASAGQVKINGFDVRRDNQFVTIRGVASHDPEDQIVLDLLNVNLDYIFESLGIDKAMLGGDATGRFYASQLFTKEPRLITDGLKVKNISYNKTVFGDALIKSRWDVENRAITLDAVIDQPDNIKSVINGAIFPLNDSLDITFRCKRIPVGFLKPYMSAFTSEVSGYASGWARLFGTFKLIDLEGDIFAEDLRLKIDFTNTVYAATDSVHITPGLISVRDITLTDPYGNHALLNGWVRHSFFKEPSFDFAITKANNFLSYDVPISDNPDWYGRIFGNGSAHVDGAPGVVNIGVDMSTAPKSVFTFVLSDREDAYEYNFITFRDRNAIAAADSIRNTLTPEQRVVNELRERMAQTEQSVPSVYNMKINVDVTPVATLILKMDPIGGDSIRANGKGSLQLDYGSANEDLRIIGSYVLEQGKYNFTLQDIIIKEFSIREGSTISFHGDPYAAKLKLQASYALNANLSDLDESFLQDKELNRTNVPVHALLNVTGDVRQPDLSFDLEFPTLTQDVYRKVRSIISTEDMMNRQIIYLLALNRFYTPDYMGSTTKGNELVSVASSTISSQLSSMLGQLSENWSIAPNFRSDRGDFSDVEVDLALSSRLLNNRLLFNGNFGYRDDALNASQFIGDFDLEYLLNKSGNIRLKAYNRYNDRNYYVRTATTTQGIGILFKRDFDSLTSFLKPLRRKKKPVEQTDSVSISATVDILNDSTVVVTDSLSVTPIQNPK
ncbi:MAG: translocation/assembly module TamB domain-containing protein [Muribaculaceae bacterium]|nr:translocation/assembly module TamB domain-containing protein [Muribaculaceae bacterium]